MGRYNKKKRSLKTLDTNEVSEPSESLLFRFLLFFLGTIGELVIIPIKLLFQYGKRTYKHIKAGQQIKELHINDKQKSITIDPSLNSNIIYYYTTKKRTFRRLLETTSKNIRVEWALFKIQSAWNIQNWSKNISMFVNNSVQRLHFYHKRPVKTHENHLRAPSIHTFPKTFSIIIRSATLILLGSLIMLSIIIGTEFYEFIQALPNPRLLTTRDIPLTTKIFDRNGILLYELYVDQNRTLVPLRDIPEAIKKATIAIEDREFYSHKGFSIRGILRAAKEGIFNNNLQGGSTITQQLIKSSLLTPDITIQRKIKEVILAFWTEQIYSKDQILEMYLNQVPYGGTAWGIESASKIYFGKSVKDTTVAEASFLAGLPAAPSEYSPFGPNPEKAYIRQHEVLRRMVEEGYLTQQEADVAKNESLVFASTNIPIRAPHFVLYTREYLLKKFGESQLLQGGLRIITTIDAVLQDKVQQIVSQEIDKLKPLQVSNGAVLVTDPKNGEILAMVGSKDYFNIENDGNVNVTTALRQPGSSIKVVSYTAALEKGFTAATLLDDSPVSYRIAGQPSYNPVNYDGKWHGLVPLRYALGNSYNIPAVKTLDRIGIQTMIEKGEMMGIDTWKDTNRFGLSLALGGGEVTMIDMAEVYGTLANEGKHITLSPILEIQDYTGKTLQSGNQSLPIQAVSPDIAWIMSNILSDNNARMQAFGANSTLVIPNKTVSVKTGTTNEKRDNWTIGYTPSFVTTVWVGNNDNSPMNPQLASGITGAAPIWNQVMKELLQNQPDEVPLKPSSVISVPCYGGRVEYFVSGTEPREGRCQTIPTVTPSPSEDNRQRRN